MNLYQKNPNTLRKLLAKRQNPCSQIFNTQPKESQNLFKSTNNPINPSSPCTFEFSDLKAQFQSSQSTSVSRKTSLDQKDNLLFKSFRKSSVQSPINFIDLESDAFETIEKKMKVNDSGKVSRRTSFDEEKEFSEHSTTCDNHSEVNFNNEAGDFIWSPTLSSQAHPARNPVILILDDDEDVPSKSESSFIFAEPNKDASIYAQAQSQAEMLGGNCLGSEGLLLKGNKLKFMCKLRHQWEASVEEMSQRWCPKCADMLTKCRAFALANGGSCLTEKFDETISFKCCVGHIWTTSSRTYNTKWCAQCANDEKDIFRRKCEEARMKREKIEEEVQNKLFEEAKRKAMGGIANQTVYSKEDVLNYFQKVDAELESQAKCEADKWMAPNEGCEVNYQQAMHVYKFLLMPEEVLRKYMMNLSAEILKQEFRRMAKIIHPDKNKHPNSGSAFQKIYRVYESVTGKCC